MAGLLQMKVYDDDRFITLAGMKMNYVDLVLKILTASLSATFVSDCTFNICVILCVFSLPLQVYQYANGRYLYLLPVHCNIF